MAAKPERSIPLRHQMRKYLPPHLEGELGPFIDAVDGLYRHYEQDREMLTRAMELSSEELTEANRELRTNNEFLEAFSYATAHDLKNHAINVTGMTSLLRRQMSEGDARVPLTLDHLERASRQLQNYLQDLLVVARTLRGESRSADDSTPEELRYMAESECSFMINKSQAHISWDIQCPEAKWPIEPWRTALVNLLSNGLKYGQPGRRPRINIHFNRIAQHSVLRVEDNGRGIDLKADGHRLFKVFSRLSAGRDQEGSGVGLFVVKRLVERCNGDLRIDSTPAEGTTITIRLPHAA